MTFLTKTEILSVEDLPHEDVDVPEWGGTVRVIGLDAAQVQAYSSKLVEFNTDGKVTKLNTETMMTDLLVRTLVDEKNVFLFNEGDIAALGKKSGAVIKRLFEISQRLSGLGNEPVKNSNGTHADVSPTV